ncbi:rifampicin phosphotransferase-like [Onthophagus taurus]|uniref:rifampicin phosphotransferase-like n=1 Tax=Onthophagus taurus TaxID=166361 RepID=UPI0039BDA72C
MSVLIVLVFLGLIYFLNRSRKKVFKVFYPIIKKLNASVTLQEIKDARDEELRNQPEVQQEQPKTLSSSKKNDSLTIYGLDQKGNSIIIKMIIKNTLHAETMIEFRLNNGKVYVFPNDEETLICSIQSRQWKANALSIQVLKPYTRLRIIFNGILKNKFPPKNDQNDLEHIQFNFIWTAGSIPFHYPQHFQKDVLIKMIQKRTWKDSNWLKHLLSINGYEQFGCLTGFLKGENYPEEITFKMPSYRTRYWGSSESISTKESTSSFGVCKNGTLFFVDNRIINGSEQDILLEQGFILLSNGQSRPINDSHVRFGKIEGNKEKINGVIRIGANRKKFSGTISSEKSPRIEIKSSGKLGWKETHFISKGHFDRNEVVVLTNFFKSSPNGALKPLPKPFLTQKSAQNPENVLICRLNSSECLDLSLTGGKGNSLGLLSNITSNFFKVPSGFVITVSAFNQQLSSSQRLKQAINRLEVACYGKSNLKIEDVCADVVEIFSNEPVFDGLVKTVEEEIKNLNDEINSDEKNWKWAVRSSGIGEDSEELSTAGQNSTYLGCRDADVLSAVRKCWGSLFQFHSVQYRIQHGLPVSAEMAVVVQKTVPADCAGVLFTCHPTSGDPSEMIITSNFGLGESVVSASADPDTIILRRTYHGLISIKSCTIGGKKIQITLGNDDTGGVEEKGVNEDDAKRMSLSEEQAVILGELGVLLEDEFGNPRDVEWAFYKNKLYLLQSRPVTTLTNWSDFELLHEFDTPVFSDDEVFTRVNIGEVMKGAITPLTQSTTLHTMDKLIQKEMMGETNPYVLMGCPTFMHYGFLNVLNTLYKNVPKKIDVEIRVSELAMLGHPFMDEKIHKECVRRHGYNVGLNKLITRVTLFNKAFFRRDRLNKAIEINRKWDITFKENETPKEIFDKLSSSFHVFEKMMTCYVNVNFTNTIYNMLCVTILTGGQSEFTPDHYHDIALVLKTKGGVETVELPVILQKISDLIRKAGKSEEFIKINSKNAIDWMKNNCGEAANVFERFLQVHGHRLFSEYEFASKPWIEDPTPILEMIQANCRTEATTKMVEGMDVNETVEKLLTPLTKRKKKILKFLIQKLRDSIVLKELTKSQFIRCLGKFRKGYKVLSERLVAQGFIPEPELMYYLTQSELGEVIEMRDPILISKALRRRRLFKQWDKMQFSDINIGFPTPDRDGTENNVFIERKSGDLVQIKGTPVCTGIVKGRACVVVDLKECSQLQPGDVLITYCTDVGWTPYFPMLSGVVTEIGGLLSHGAVVAREYGLPCIVGAQGAAKTFKTGDLVVLNGKTGELQLIE